MTGSVAPMLVLRARAEARALLFAAGEFTLGEAIDPLFAYAERSGLLALLGRESIDEIIFDAFGIKPA
jgi:hypothetical protein